MAYTTTSWPERAAAFAAEAHGKWIEYCVAVEADCRARDEYEATCAGSSDARDVAELAWTATTERRMGVRKAYDAARAQLIDHVESLR